MTWHHLRQFFGRRFAPGEYLGLHLTLGLLLSLVTLVLFVWIFHSIRKDRGELERFDLRVAEQLEHHAQGHPVLLHVCRWVTYAGGVLALMLLTLCGSLTLLAQRRPVLATVWLLAGIGCGLLNIGLKNGIGRHRPANPDAAVREHNPSFPSGHSMGSVVIYGMAGYTLGLRRRRRRGMRTAINVALGVLVLLIGFSRMYLRAHYFSDVIGGFCVGTVWLAACVSGLEAARIHRDSRSKEGEPTSAGPGREYRLPIGPAPETAGGHPPADSFEKSSSP